MQSFLNRHKETQSKRTGMAVNGKVLRISEFPDTCFVGDISSYHLWKLHPGNNTVLNKRFL